MFTGLVEIIGAIDRVTESELGRELRVRCHWVDLRLGESIALNGACLTVRTADAGWFTVSAVSTTLDRTTIGSWAVGSWALGHGTDRARARARARARVWC